VAHDERRNAAAGGAVVTMDIGTADPAGADLDQDVVRTADRIGHVHVGHLLIFGEEQGFHEERKEGFGEGGKVGMNAESIEYGVSSIGEVLVLG
jgi:hypothetical protein